MPFIRFLPARGVATLGGPGDVVEVDDSAAKTLVRDGYAEAPPEAEAKAALKKKAAAAAQ